MGRKTRLIELGGRRFDAIVGNSTVEHDTLFMQHIYAAGLNDLPLNDGEQPDAYANRLLSALIVSGRCLPIIGCLVMPAGEDPATWTPEIGQATAQFVAGLTNPEDKNTYRQLVLSVLIPFLASGLGPLQTIATSSSPNGDPAGETEKSAGAELTPTGTGAP